AFAGDTYLLAVVAGLAVLGALGFHALAELRQRVLRGGSPRLSLHTRVVLAGTLATFGAGSLLTLLLEWNNPATLGALPPATRVVNGLFAGAAARTSGFSTVDTAGLTAPTLLGLVVLMFIGGAP